jgi:hypothetical protein
MKHIQFYEMKQKKENMILTEELDDEIHFEIDDFEVLDLMLIYEIFLNHFLDDDEIEELLERKIQVIFVEKILK